MLNFPFANYAEFQDLFGIDYHGNGAKSRRNKILLNHYKNPALLRWCREHDDYTLMQITTMAALKKEVLNFIQNQGKQDPSLHNKVQLIGKTYWSALYRTDELNGICKDFDKKSVRYINVERNRDYKMKAGKFFGQILRETEIGKILSESVIVYLCEEFAQDWETYTTGQTPAVELHVDNDFEKIYSSYWCPDFHGNSCMCDRDRWSFYRDSTDAQAAYITGPDGKVLCRAILFPHVLDENGQEWQLLERQYSRDNSDVLKRILIDLLIKAGKISAYKIVGAACSAANSFTDIHGNDLSHKKFSIRMDLEPDDTLSYQDSFKWYVPATRTRDGRAYNYRHPDT